MVYTSLPKNNASLFEGGGRVSDRKELIPSLGQIEPSPAPNIHNHDARLTRADGHFQRRGQRRSRHAAHARGTGPIRIALHKPTAPLIHSIQTADARGLRSFVFQADEPHCVRADRRKDLRFHRAVVRAARRFHVEGEIQRLARRALRQPFARRRNRQRALIDAQKTPVQPRRRDGRRAAARMRSPSCEEQLTMRSNSLSGFWVSYPVRWGSFCCKWLISSQTSPG